VRRGWTPGHSLDKSKDRAIFLERTPTWRVQTTQSTGDDSTAHHVGDGALKFLNKHQKTVLIIAWLGWVFDVMEASLFALTKQPMLKQMLGEAGYKLNGVAWEGKIHTAMLLGWSLGGLIFGVVADRWGRSKTLILTVFLYCLFTGLTALCQSPEQVQIARFLTGLGIGGEWAAGAALIAETMPENFRARAAAFLQSAAAIGSIAGVFINVSLGETNWKFVYLAGIAPALLCLVARFRLEPDQPPVKAPSLGQTESKTLLKPPYFNRLIVAILIGVVGITGGGILPFWLPNLVKDMVPEASFAYYKNLSMVVLHLGTLAGVLVFPPLTDRYGRRPMFALFGVAAGALLFITATQAKSLTLLFVLAPLTSFFALGLTAGFGLYFPELFSKNIRATGSGLAYNTGRILSAPIPIWIGATAKTSGVATAIGTVASIYLIMMVALAFAPETRGQTLEQA
jgi:MFS family permease